MTLDIDALEDICRGLCKEIDLDPDKECYGLGHTMPAGSKYPAWKYQLKTVKHVLDSLGIPYDDPTDEQI